jgi:hypothetical protein
VDIVAPAVDSTGSAARMEVSTDLHMNMWFDVVSFWK